MSSETKLPKFLGNEPLGLDLFEGQSQKTIADSIALLLKNHSSQMIGIDGGWGTGKSNLVKIVENDLRSVGYKFFTYDSWGHQEDLQRRSILEELTEFLIHNISNFCSDTWKYKLKGLLAKNRETTTKTKPSLSPGIILSFLAVVFTPILNVLTEDINYKWLKVAIMSLPIVLLIIWYCKIFFRIKEKGKGCFFNAKKALQEMFLIYKKDQIENTTYEIISEDEPSVKKFRDWMQDINDDLQDNKLVLVFDNMDRLPNVKVQELWSSIHAFFADRQYDKISVIVPFDREHIKLAFSDNDLKNGEGKCFGDDFINKTFTIVYRVSEPILSNWKGFFILKWQEALDTDDPDLTRVIQIYDVLKSRITPREIIAFINEFVSIRLISKYEIPSRYIALFIIGKSIILKNPLSEIISPTYLAGLSFLYESDKDLPKYITALTYQIKPKNSLQVIYTKQLKDALNNKEEETTKLISKSPEFFDVLMSILPEIENIENAILMLDKVDSDSFKSSDLEQEVWNILSTKIFTLKNEDLVLKQFQKILIKKIQTKEELVLHLKSSFLKTEEFNALKFAKIIDEMEEILMDCKSPFSAFKYLDSKETSVDDFMNFVSSKQEQYKKYFIYCDNDGLDEALSKLTVEQLEQIDYVPHILDDYALEKFTLAIKKQINEKLNDAISLAVLYKRLKEVTEGKVDILLTDAHIVKHFSNLSSESDFYYDLFGMRIARQLSFADGPSRPFDTVFQSGDEKNAIKLASVLHRYIDYDNFLLGLEHFNKLPLYVKVAQILTLSDDLKLEADVIKLTKGFDLICREGKIDPIIMFNKICSFNWNTIILSNVKEALPVSIIQIAVASNESFAAHILQTVKEYLNNLSEEDWNEAFVKVDSYEIQAAITIDYAWDTKSMNALKFILVEIAKGNVSLPNPEIWGKVIDSIEKSGRKLVMAFNNVRDVFCSMNNMTTALFLFFGRWLFIYASLDKKQEVLRTIIPTSILSDTKCLTLILNNKDKLPAIIDKAGEEEASDFKSAISDLAQNEENTLAKELAKSLGYKIKKRKDEDD